MSSSNPDTWATPKWHSDFGNPEEEMTRLRDFAKAFLARCPQVLVRLQQPEEGYMYVEVSHSAQKIAELYCVKDPERPETLRYGVFLFTNGQEEERYCSTVAEAVKMVEPLIRTAKRAS